MEEELRDKPFVTEEVKRLLKQKQKTLHDGPLTTHYYEIPTPKMKTYLRRARLLWDTLHIKKPLTFWVIPAKVPRLFPAPGEPLSEKHLNGGYTYLNNNNIYIYRYEDFPKVMLHEVIHHSYLNTHTPYNEAIVEFWAVLFHLFFISTPATFESYFQDELNWNLFLCKKLLQHNADISHADSYIFAKTALLFHRDNYLNGQPFSPKMITAKPFQQAIQSAPDYNQDSMRMVWRGNH